MRHKPSLQRLISSRLAALPAFVRASELDPACLAQLALDVDHVTNRRALPGAFAYTLFLLWFSLTTELGARLPRFSFWITAASIVAGATRLRLFMNRPNARTTPGRRVVWHRMADAAATTCVVLWAMYVAVSIHLLGFCMTTLSMVVVMCGLLIGVTYSYAPRETLMRWLLVLLLGPTLCSTLVVHESGMAILMLTDLGYLVFLGHRLNDEYWRSAVGLAQLQNGRDAMRLVLDNVEQGFLTLDREARIAAERSAVVDTWFGACPHDATFADYLRPLDPVAAASFAVTWKALIESVPTPARLERLRNQLPSRLAVGDRIFEIAYRPIVEQGSTPAVFTRMLVVISDITMRARLMVSDRMASLGTLAAGIAHEINNPLAYVAGNLEVMAETVEAAHRSSTAVDGAELGAAIRDARDGAERVRKIVHGLRSFSRSEEEKRVPLALPGVLEAAIRLTGNEVRHRAQLVRELGPTPLVVADDGRLTQVFINLLVNAAHAIPQGRSDKNRITVRTRRDDEGRAVIEIEDTGKGMTPEVQARVFDPFFTTKGVGEGTGLGLSICHGIVIGLGGQISIESAPGRGTVVRVVLPASTEEAAPPPATEASPATTEHRRYRVMLVDDEPQVAHTMERLLRRDYDVTVALCGREAMEHIANHLRFDAIVSDVMMPNMTGIELIEELQRVAPDQAERLIFLSGGAFTAQTRERLDQLGAPQLEKPVTANELRACVMRMARTTTSPVAPARRGSATALPSCEP